VGRRLTRKEIKKKDPITETLESLWAYFVENRKNVLVVLSCMLIIFVIALVGMKIYENQKISMMEAVDKASTLRRDMLMSLPVTDGDSPTDSQTSKADKKAVRDAQAKKKKALEELKELAGEYGSSGFGGTMISYYEGVSLRDFGQFPESEEVLKTILQEDRSPDFLEVTRMALAETYRTQGKYAEALKLYDELLGSGSSFMPSEVYHFNKALCLEESGKIAEAYELLKTVHEGFSKKREENPQYMSPLESDIKNRMEILKAKWESDRVQVS